jgi:hypothetical protein
MKYPYEARVLGRKIVAVVDNSGTDLRDSSKRVKCLTVYYPERGPDSPARSFSLFGSELEELLELLDVGLGELH